MRASQKKPDIAMKTWKKICYTSFVMTLSIGDDSSIDDPSGMVMDEPTARHESDSELSGGSHNF